MEDFDVFSCGLNTMTTLGIARAVPPLEENENDSDERDVSE